LVQYLATGVTVDDLLADFPDLERDDLQAGLELVPRQS
jgi:uncharacterized protein (DUF433 family)